MRAKKDAAAATKADTATGLFVRCGSWEYLDDHRHFVEVRTCRNGAYHVYCRDCRTTLFLRHEEWRRKAKTLESLSAILGWNRAFPVIGGPVRGPG